MTYWNMYIYIYPVYMYYVFYLSGEGIYSSLVGLCYFALVACIVCTVVEHCGGHNYSEYNAARWNSHLAFLDRYSSQEGIISGAV